LLEALAYGVPVLASDIAPNVEILGENGDYFAAGDVDSLSQALGAALAPGRDAGSAHRQSPEEALAEYDWDRIAQETIDFYERACERAGRRPVR
jgi:glycosyltransferase involved in cell wall biosynthesis